MPRTRSLAWSELKIGVLTIIAAAIAGVTIVMLTGGRGFPWERYTLKTRFNNVAGLKAGSPVRLAGVEVGSVRNVDLSGEEVDVTFEVKDDYKGRITTESRSVLGSVSLLGESSVDITPSNSGQPIPEFGYVKAGPPASLLADVTTQAGQGIEQLTGLLTDVRNGKGTVGKLMTDEALYAELNRFVVSANDMTQRINQGRGTIGKLLNDPGAANELEATLRHVNEITAALNAGEGSLGKLLKDESFSRSLSSATSNMDAITARLNRGEGTAGKLLNDPALFDRLNSVSQRLDQLVTNLNEGQGTAGLLLKDKQLYENMNKAVSDVQGLIAELKSFFGEIKKDPKKYLNVKVSIF